ncbi:protein kinase, partial [Myxococcota bacterium]|nr:protein kinase [Myxococcota bacterium]
ADTIAGTPEYMAPEQARGVKGDRRSDIYSLGIILYEMLTNDLPYLGKTSEEVFHKSFHDPVPSLRVRYPELDIPVEVDALLERALAKDPIDRYQNLEQFISDLNRCFGRVFYSRDIPTVLKNNKDINIDPSLASDLNRLFSGPKKRNSSLQSKKKITSVEKSQSVTALRKKESLVVQTREYGTTEPVSDVPAQAPKEEKTIDPSLARDLSSLFGKGKNKK